MHDGSRLSYHLFLYFVVVVCKDGGGGGGGRVVTVIFYLGRRRDMHTFNDRPREVPINVPEYISLSLSGTSAFQSVDGSVDVFRSAGNCSVSPPTPMYIMYILYVCVYHKMRYICLDVRHTLSGIERQYYVA